MLGYIIPSSSPGLRMRTVSRACSRARLTEWVTTRADQKPARRAFGVVSSVVSQMLYPKTLVKPHMAWLHGHIWELAYYNESG